MVSTIEGSVPSSALRWEPVPTPPRRRWPWVAVPATLAALALLASFLVTVPYYRIAPGSALAVTSLISAPDDRIHRPDGAFLLTTVSLGETRAIEAFLGWLDPDVDVVPRERLLPPDITGEQYLELARLDMIQSKQAAIVVALRRLGFDVPEMGEGAIIVRVVDGLPAAGKLVPGDVVVAVDGQAVATSTDAVRLIRTRAPGDTVSLQVRRQGGDGPAETVNIVAAEQPDNPGQPLLGIQLRTHQQRFDFPFPVSIDFRNIGGPSAGLAFTLAVIDLLSPGELTGGRAVAVTGTIDFDGSVGMVGGVGQKAAAVKESGAKVFLVPADEEAQARSHVGRSVQVIGVRTLEDALAALARLGGDTAALGPVPPQAGS